MDHLIDKLADWAFANGPLAIALLFSGLAIVWLQRRLDKQTEARIEDGRHLVMALGESAAALREAADAQRRAAEASRDVAESLRLLEAEVSRSPRRRA